MSPETFIRSPRKTQRDPNVDIKVFKNENKGASTKQKIREIADDNNFFQTYNSDVYRGHINKVDRMALRGG